MGVKVILSTLRRWLVGSNVALRGLMEAGIVLALGYWGYTTGGSGLVGVALAIAAPLIGFGIWGAVDFRWAGRWAEMLRLVEELLISGLAALALFGAGATLWGLLLAALSLLHHGLVYGLGQRLLKS